MLPKSLLVALTILISLAWIANIAIGWVDPARSIPAVNTIFGIVTGSLFALGQKDTAVAAIKSIQGKKGQRSKQPEEGDQP